MLLVSPGDWRCAMKYTVTGKGRGASDLPFILRVQGKYLCLFGITLNDALAKHRATLALTPVSGIEQRKPRAL